MGKKIFQPEKYGMVICSQCNGQGYIQARKRRCCPKCGGFGFVRKETEKEANVPPKIINSKIPRWFLPAISNALFTFNADFRNHPYGSCSFWPRGLWVWAVERIASLAGNPSFFLRKHFRKIFWLLTVQRAIRKTTRLIQQLSREGTVSRLIREFKIC